MIGDDRRRCERKGMLQRSVRLPHLVERELEEHDVTRRLLREEVRCDDREARIEPEGEQSLGETAAGFAVGIERRDVPGRSGPLGELASARTDGDDASIGEIDEIREVPDDGGEVGRDKSPAGSQGDPDGEGSSAK